MGIHGIYQEIGPGRRVALSKLAAEHYIAHSRPFRLAIDISIWLFQIQSGKGGSNPALRTFYYRLLRLLSLNIHPLFVFDGPNKPKFKRNKRVGGPNVKVADIPEFLAKQLLKHFGFPFHYAPGEAEAECALLQREGIVDAVLSEDVDTLMFGSGMTLRSWTAEQRSSKTPTHVNVHEAQKTKDTSGLDREGMILIAMMSGGDYITEGIPGCGPKLACDAARAGFGTELCNMDKKNTHTMNEWRDRLRHEIRTNESNFFRGKRPSLSIPDTFPNIEVLGYYTHPCISGHDKIAKLRDSLKWDAPLDYPSLRDFTADAFDWRCLGGAKKFVRNLAPAVLVRELRMRGEAVDDRTNTIDDQEQNEAALINAIHGKRIHPTTDNSPELRVSFTPIQLVDIDLSIEDPDEEEPDDDEGSESEPLPTQDPGDQDGECPSSPKKKRAPSKYDPTIHEKIWLLDTFVRLGAPLKVQDWEASAGAPKAKATRTRKPLNEKKTGGMPKGALDRFAKTTKPGIDRQAQKKSSEVNELDLSGIDGMAKERATTFTFQQPPKPRPAFAEVGLNRFTKVTKPGVDRQARKKSPEVDELDLSGIDAIAKERAISSALQHPSKSRPAITEVDLTQHANHGRKRASKRPSPEPVSPPRRVARPKMMSPVRKSSSSSEIIEILSSPVKLAPLKKVTPPPPDIRNHFRPCSRNGEPDNQDEIGVLLPDTVTRRRRRSPLKRFRTAPVAGDDDMMSPIQNPSTPHAIAIEAIDLASSGSLPSLPRLGLFQNQKNDRQRDTQNQAKRPTEVQSPSTRPRPSNSRSISPVETGDDLNNRKEIEIVRLSSPMPNLTHEEETKEEVDKTFTRQTISASALLPFNKRLRDRKVETGSSKSAAVSVASESVTTQETYHSKSTSSKTVSLDERLQSKKSNKTTKRFIQPRESLPGAWKEIEVEIDLTAPAPIKQRWFRKSGVEEVDLTGD